MVSTQGELGSCRELLAKVCFVLIVEVAFMGRVGGKGGWEAPCLAKLCLFLIIIVCFLGGLQPRIIFVRISNILYYRKIEVEGRLQSFLEKSAFLLDEEKKQLFE